MRLILTLQQVLDAAKAASLEELSLTPIEKDDELENLNIIMSIADCLQEVDTDNIDPMTTCVEDR